MGSGGSRAGFHGVCWCFGSGGGWVAHPHLLASVPRERKCGCGHATHIHSTRRTCCRCFECRRPCSACSRPWPPAACGDMCGHGRAVWLLAGPPLTEGDHARSVRAVAAPHRNSMCLPFSCVCECVGGSGACACSLTMGVLLWLCGAAGSGCATLGPPMDGCWGCGCACCAFRCSMVTWVCAAVVGSCRCSCFDGQAPSRAAWYPPRLWRL